MEKRSDCALITAWVLCSMALLVGCGLSEVQPLPTGSDAGVEVDADMGTNADQGDDALSVSPLLLEPNPVMAGSTVQVLWASVKASSCQAGPDGENPLPGWTSQALGLQGPLAYTIPASTAAGTYDLAVTCVRGAREMTQRASLQVDASGPMQPPEAPTLTVNASASDITIEAGAPLSIAWSSTGASSCEASGSLPGWSGTKPTSGDESSLDTSGAPAGTEYSIELRCSNASGSSAPTSRIVTIEDAGPGPCGPDQKPPTSMTRARSCYQIGQVDCTSYEAVFGGFPGTTSIRFMTLAPNTYAAMAFTPDMVPDEAKLNLNVEAIQTGIPRGQLLWSISTCPGDFNRDSVLRVMGDEACFKSKELANSGFNFGGSSYLSDPNRCGLALAPGTTYYLNLTYTNDDPATTPGSDLTWACGLETDVTCGQQTQPTSISGWD